MPFAMITIHVQKLYPRGYVFCTIELMPSDRGHAKDVPFHGEVSVFRRRTVFRYQTIHAHRNSRIHAKYVDIRKATVTKPVRGIHHEKYQKTVSFGPFLGRHAWSDLTKNFYRVTPSPFPILLPSFVQIRLVSEET